MPDDSKITVTTTLGSGLNEEIQVDPGDYQPPAPPEAQVITGTTTDTEAGLRSTEGVPVKDSSLADYREVESGDVRVTSYEAENSSRHRLEESFKQYQADLERLRFPEDEEFVQQLAEQQGVELPAAEPTPPEANMIPAEQVGAVIEQGVILREHQQRMAQAMQNQEFVEYAAQAPGVDVEWAPEIGVAVAAQANSPVVVAYLSNNPALAQDIAGMPVARGVAEVAKLSAWLQVQLQQPQTAPPPPRRASTAPPPIKPLGGNPTTAPVVDLSNCDYQTYKRVREQQEKKGRR